MSVCGCVLFILFFVIFFFVFPYENRIPNQLLKLKCAVNVSHFVFESQIIFSRELISHRNTECLLACFFFLLLSFTRMVLHSKLNCNSSMLVIVSMNVLAFILCLCAIFSPSMPNEDGKLKHFFFLSHSLCITFNIFFSHFPL